MPPDEYQFPSYFKFDTNKHTMRFLDTDWRWESRTFTAEQIKAMSMSEYAFYRDRLRAEATNTWLGADRITIPPLKADDDSSWLTCMWCAAGPFATAEELESHEEQC